MRGGGEVPLYPVYPVEPLGPTPGESPCAPLLVEFARRSAELALCSLRNARPLRLCGSCVIQQWSANRTYGQILTTVQGDNETCERSLLRSDRLQLVYQQHSFSQGLWDAAACEACLVNGTNGTRGGGFVDDQLHAPAQRDAHLLSRELAGAALWSTRFKCVEYCRDNASVLAVSIFMCMLPIFFYMSSVIHSRQRKRRLVTSKRMKSTNSSASLHRAQ
ncbi:unnamed protein product [Lampetra planeri]